MAQLKPHAPVGVLVEAISRNAACENATFVAADGARFASTEDGSSRPGSTLGGFLIFNAKLEPEAPPTPLPSW